MLSEVSESVMGAAVVRAYGLDDTIHDRVTGAIGRRYDAEVKAHLRAATLWPMSSVFYALTLAVVIAVGAVFGPEWGRPSAPRRRSCSSVTCSRACSRTCRDLETQTAIAGWRKILAVLDLAIEIEEPADGDVTAEPRRARCRGPQHDVRLPREAPVLHDIRSAIRPGHVAIVGETGSGKTTFAKLLTRLADPRTGSIEVRAPTCERSTRRLAEVAIRMVPQDGFLFDWTVRENVKAGREGATDREVDAAFERDSASGCARSRTSWTPVPVSAVNSSLSASDS